MNVSTQGVSVAGTGSLFSMDLPNTGRELPVIIRAIPARRPSGDPENKKLIQRVSEFLWTSGLEAVHVTWSQTTVQVLATLPGDVPATAGDHETPGGMQKALSAGLYVNPGDNIHQINKRMKLISGDGEGLIANPERPRLFEFIQQGRDHGTIHINNSLSLRTMILNTGESDDGAMAIRGMPWEHGTPGHRLVRALGLRSPHRCNYSMVNMGLDDAFIKGLLQHIAQAQWRFPPQTW